jgi:hypothetical protein
MLQVALRCYFKSCYRDADLNRVLAPESEILSFAPPRQLLLRCSTSCIRAVEKKVSKDQSAGSGLGRQRRTKCECQEGASQKAARCRFSPALLAFTGGCQKGRPWPSGNARLPCRAPAGRVTRHMPVPRPAGATHANRLSCRFVPAKAPVLGAANGNQSMPQ